MEDFASTTAAVEKNIRDKMEANDISALDRVVIAGQKVMFSKETHKYMTEILDKEGELSDKLAMGMVDLMMILINQSNGALLRAKDPEDENSPNLPGIIIPAATILLGKACEFVDQTDGGMDTKVYGDALKLMTVGISRKLEQMSKQGAEKPEEKPEASAQQPGGLINQGA